MWWYSYLWRTAVAWVLCPISFHPISCWAGLRLFPPLHCWRRWQVKKHIPLLEQWVLVVLTLASLHGSVLTASVQILFHLFTAVSSWCIIPRNLDPVYIYNHQPRNKKEEEKFRAEISCSLCTALSVMVMAGAALGHLPSQEEVFSSIQIPLCQIPLWEFQVVLCIPQQGLLNK